MSANPSSQARAIALRVLTRVQEQGAYATLALSAELDRSNLSTADRALTTELVYGVLRHRLRIDRTLDSYAKKGIGKLPPGVLHVLRIACYQLLFLDRIPSHAAVNEAVSAVRRMTDSRLAGFANGVLRSIANKGEPSLETSTARERAMLEHSMPEWLVDSLAEHFAGEELVQAAAGFQSRAPLHLRVNRLRADTAELAGLLRAGGASVDEIEGMPWALRCEGLGAPDRNAAYEDGLYSVQDLSAQWICELLPTSESGCYLDACAGLGGKSHAWAEATRDQASITAIDRSSTKIRLLREGAQRLGLRSITAQVEDLLAMGSEHVGRYDAVLLDAPCSGLGVLRRHPERKWQPAPTDELASVQTRMLDRLAPLVRAGGVLVYSVCTFRAAEGRDQIDGFLARHGEFALDPVVAPAWWPAGPGTTSPLTSRGELQIWPHLHGGDAFYGVRLRRSGAAQTC